MELRLKKEVEVGMEMELARSVRLLVVVESMSPISHNVSLDISAV